MLRKAVGVIQILTTPFVESGDLYTATRGLVAAEKIVQENEFIFRRAALKCLCQPVILLAAK